MEWSNEITLEFIKLYELESPIWNPKDPQHKNRNVVSDGWLRIQNSMPVEFSIKDLKRKKESLMATFRTLFKKVRAGVKFDDGEIFKPSWFAYEAMEKFLSGIYQPRATRNTEESDEPIEMVYIKREEDANEADEAEEEDEDMIFAESNAVAIAEIPPMVSNQDTLFKSPPRKKRKDTEREGKQPEDRMEKTYKMIKHVSKKLDKDDCSLYADLLANKLRAFDEHTRDVLMHDIDELIFKTKMQQRAQQYQPQSHPLITSVNSSSPYNLHISTPSPSHLQTIRKQSFKSHQSPTSPEHSHSSSSQQLQLSPTHSYHSNASSDEFP